MSDPVGPSVDAEQLVVAYLLSRSDVTALASQRIYTEVPPSAVFPLVRLERIGGVSRTEEWLDEPILEIWAWAEVGGRLAAKTLIEALRIALGPSQIIGPHELGYVTDSRENRGPMPLPDAPTGRPRFSFDLALTVHPH